MSKHTDLMKLIDEYVANNDVFWLFEMKKELGFDDGYEASVASRHLIDLCKSGILMPSERKGNHIQYIRLK